MLAKVGKILTHSSCSGINLIMYNKCFHVYTCMYMYMYMRTNSLHLVFTCIAVRTICHLVHACMCMYMQGYFSQNIIV